MATQDKTAVKLISPFEFSNAQRQGSGIPYSELVKAYLDVYPERREAFGKKSSLGQAMELMDNLNPDAEDVQTSNKMASKALYNIHRLPAGYTDRRDALPLSADITNDSLYAGAEPVNPEIRYNPFDYKAVLRNTANELASRIGQLKSMTKPEVTLQKLKEKSGKDYISDKDFLEGNDPYSKAPDYNIVDTVALQETPQRKHMYDVTRDSTIYNFPGNIVSPEDSTKAVERAKAKKEYQEGFHPIDIGLKFTPLSPIAVAAENGEPLSRGLAGAGTSIAGAVGGVLASPFITPVGGAALAGASNALGDEIARGERPDELSTFETTSSYGIPTLVGGGMGAAGGAVGNKVSKYLKDKKLKGLEAESKAAEDAYQIAKQDYKNANQYMYKGMPYDPTKLGKTAEEEAAEESTSKVMALIKQGKFNELDPVDIDNLILNPDRAEAISNALALQKESFANEDARLALLQKLNSDPRFIRKVNQVLETEGVDPAYTEYGSDDLVKMARGEARQDLNNTTDLNNEIASLVNPDNAERYYYNPSAQDIAASKLVYSEANLPKTADQVIFNKSGYDQWGKAPVTGTDMPYRARGLWDNGKGLLIKEVNASMPNADDAVKSKVINPFISQYIDHRTAPGISFGRGAQIQAQSYVEEAAEGILDRTIKDADGLNRVFDEYKKWRLPAVHTQADEDAIKREFVANIKIALNKPGAGYAYKDPSTMSTNDIANRGKDVLRAIRNPATSELHSSDPYGRLSFNQLRTMYDPNRSPENFLDDIATMLDHNNIRLRAGEIQGDPAFGWAGGFERPSKEAIGAFTGRKDKNRFRYTIQPALEEVMRTNPTATKAAVIEKGKAADIAEDKAKKAREIVNIFRDSRPKNVATYSTPVIVSPFINTYESGSFINNPYGLSNTEEATRKEERGVDKTNELKYNALNMIPLINKAYKPKASEAKYRGNFMPFNYQYQDKYKKKPQ
jgi:hypothetical protein